MSPNGDIYPVLDLTRLILLDNYCRHIETTCLLLSVHCGFQPPPNALNKSTVATNLA